MIRFDAMREYEFPKYWQRLVESGKSHMQKAGFLEEGISFAEAEEELKQFLTAGVNTPGHYFMNILDGEEKVGCLWVEIRVRRSIEAYLWDIFIDEDRRGRGYGKESMLLLEEFSRAKGADMISLNVYAFNTVARSLYAKTGYRDAAITMLKSLR